jgi:Fe-S-cluster containining protein
MQSTKLKLSSSLPLTCTRAGTCCHGNVVMLNPWEIHILAKAKKLTPKEFQETYCEPGGIQLKFKGKANHKGKQACGLYSANFGCSVHSNRPLACRLFPLGRLIQNDAVHYMHQGLDFPCLDECPDVIELPNLTVGEYLKGQGTEPFETAQDLYLEVMQNIADIAFELLLDQGLAKSGDKTTLPLWRKMGNETAPVLADRLGNDWLNILMLPEITDHKGNPSLFVQKHFETIQIEIQQQLGEQKTNLALKKASVLVMGLALHLARAIGANPEVLANHWADTALGFGAKE